MKCRDLRVRHLKGEKWGFSGLLRGLWTGESASLGVPSLRLAGSGWLASSRLPWPNLESAGRMKNSLLAPEGFSGEASGDFSSLSGALVDSMASTVAEGRLSTMATR